MKDFIKTLVFTVVVPGTVAVYIPYRLLGRHLEVEFSGYHIFGVLLIAVGACFYFWCAWDFSFTGHGTPAPIDAPKVLVSRGLYRVVRNPMYLAVLLVVFGESLIFSSWRLVRYALFIWLMAHLFVLFYEEPVLRNKFGKAYEEYCRDVWRWIPRIPKARMKGEEK